MQETVLLNVNETLFDLSVSGLFSERLAVIHFASAARRK
jgi:hypothetical protein